MNQFKPCNYSGAGNGQNNEPLSTKPEASAPVVTSEWLPAAVAKINSFPGEMESIGRRTTDVALRLAIDVATGLAEGGVKPRRIVPAADGGVTFYIGENGGKIVIEDGGVCVLAECTAAVAVETITGRSSATARHEAEARGRAEERAAVVAWLREHGGDAFLEAYRKDIPDYRASLGEAMDWGTEALADHIEAGEHIAKEADRE